MGWKCENNSDSQSNFNLLSTNVERMIIYITWLLLFLPEPHIIIPLFQGAGQVTGLLRQNYAIKVNQIRGGRFNTFWGRWPSNWALVSKLCSKSYFFQLNISLGGHRIIFVGSVAQIRDGRFTTFSGRWPSDWAVTSKLCNKSYLVEY